MQHPRLDVARGGLIGRKSLPQYALLFRTFIAHDSRGITIITLPYPVHINSQVSTTSCTREHYQSPRHCRREENTNDRSKRKPR
jgi:hypothetical protein